MTTVAVLGAGSWGTTLANVLAQKGHEVRLWAYEQEVVEGINSRHQNPVFLEGCPLAESIRASNDAAQVVTGAPVVLSVIPSHAVRSVVAALGGHVGADTLVVSATKGIETDTLELMHEVLADCLPGRPLAVLSGPSFAREVYDGQPTAVVAASGQLEPRRAGAGGVRDAAAQDLHQHRRGRGRAGRFAQERDRHRCGILEGLGMGHNPRAALITRGLAEIARLGDALGADPHTFAGLAGMGDLVLTAFGPQSRNHSLGVALGQGDTLEAYAARHRTVAEGVNTARAAVRLAAKHHVEMPITAKVAEILFEGKPPRATVAELMGRDLKAGTVGLTMPRTMQEFYSIGEVCDLTDLKPHVLRYWESQFRFLSPAKNRAGNRVYKSKEVELIMMVKNLLYTEKYTIEGARQQIDHYRREGSSSRWPSWRWARRPSASCVPASTRRWTSSRGQGTAADRATRLN